MTGGTPISTTNQVVEIGAITLWFFNIAMEAMGPS